MREDQMDKALRSLPSDSDSSRLGTCMAVSLNQRPLGFADVNIDIDNARKVLGMAKIIDRSSKWIAGTDILVQTGDIVDRGTLALDIYRMMQDLRGQASAAGGEVVSILGNHEVMNAIGDWR